ncbi:MAG: PHP domain-containing protein [Clostridiales bacterium]|jgi:predicted metal-dependent phosphoesterase TrpH|nr:PHP domain-containing protein [Clostridiales bacterium]MDR2713293.1 PHP domain-containing protein [Clostridiales bacterium]
MDKPYVDLHIHSFYSDSSMSPEEIIEAAVANGVGTVAIVDHNTLDGSIMARTSRLRLKELATTLY